MTVNYRNTMYELLQNIGVFTVALGLIAWVFRSLGMQYLNKNLELHKSELDKNVREFQHELDTSLESERNQFKLEFIKYSRIHEERLKIIRELYKHLVNLHRSMKELTQLLWPSTGEAKEERRKRVIDQAIESLDSFENYYTYEKIMFNEETCKLIDEVLKEFSESFRLNTFEERWGPGDKAMKDFKEESADIINQKIPKILSNLENEFREQIGSFE